MSYSLNSESMKVIDKYSIEEVGIESAVLMERAALKLSERIEKDVAPGAEICVIYGPGNNGGDGLAAARILKLHGYKVCAIPATSDIPTLSGSGESSGSSIYDAIIKKSRTKLSVQCEKQLKSASACGVSIYESSELSEVLSRPGIVLIDAIFGIGLSRKVGAGYDRTIDSMNISGARIYSVDIPSGVSADTGEELGCAVRAYATVTFGFMKHGLLLYPGAELAGHVYVEDAGFAVNDNNIMQHSLIWRGSATYFRDRSEAVMPERVPYSNKGTYGKVLFIGAADGCAGAGYLSTAAAYYSGAGLVKALCGKDAVTLINNRLPEAMTGVLFTDDGYDMDVLEDGIKWATTIVIGPGLGRSAAAVSVLKWAFMSEKPVVYDADALGIISDKFINGVRESRAKSIADLFTGPAVLTPHIGEMSGLSWLDSDYIKAHVLDIAAEYAFSDRLAYAVKDARTVVSSAGMLHINTFGNNGMSTGGSGDVLSGLIAGLLAGGLSVFDAARTGVYIHACAGDRAAEKRGVASMLAGDILAELPEVIKEISET